MPSASSAAAWSTPGDANPAGRLHPAAATGRGIGPGHINAAERTPFS